MTEELKKVIDNLTSNIAAIQKSHSECLSENIILNERINDLVEKIGKKEKEIEDINKKYESLKLAKTIAASSVDSHDAKIKLNRIVKEVDKCISLLNK